MHEHHDTTPAELQASGHILRDEDLTAIDPNERVWTVAPAATEAVLAKPIAAEPADFVTVLTSADGKLLTKRHVIENGEHKTINNDTPYLVTSRREPVGNLDELGRVLGGIGQRSCIVWGRSVDGLDASKPHRRIKEAKVTHFDGSDPAAIGGDATMVEPACYEDAAHHYLPIDLDGPEVPGWNVAFEQGELHPMVRQHMLPAELQDVDCWYAQSSSAGLNNKVKAPAGGLARSPDYRPRGDRLAWRCRG